MKLVWRIWDFGVNVSRTLGESGDRFHARETAFEVAHPILGGIVGMAVLGGAILACMALLFVGAAVSGTPIHH